LVPKRPKKKVFLFSFSQGLLVGYIGYTSWHLEVVLAISLNFCYMQLSTCIKFKKDFGIHEKIMIALNFDTKHHKVG